ncbi:hypothetical protein IMF27_28415 [Pseudomonas sp. PCH199]|uniref:hypothetical protein n=1 Tax=unclassified Pseudomonas TaxID=196821 RepID=UPI000BCABCFB|nr:MULTISPECIES: hypothetical protein [unclassified Pseudomonas]MCW8278957.1 hypothetical protein [Pseudomonas sp. PCH199]PAM79788.1 hypothetical protein CES87_29080 [Pseudomonas sp. ERMR1:02]
MRNRLAWIGSVITAIYLVGFTWFVFGRLPELQTMALNNFGDFLAGAFGPIAFFWLILGFMQQGTELRLSSEALRMQAVELKASVQQQTALVEAQKISLENHERSLEPLLEVTYKGPGNLYGLEVDWFHVVNRGAYCRNVTAQFFGAGQEMHGIVVNPLAKDIPQEFRNTLGLPVNQEYKLSISYEKVNGRQGAQHFALFKHFAEDGVGFAIT